MYHCYTCCSCTNKRLKNVRSMTLITQHDAISHKITAHELPHDVITTYPGPTHTHITPPYVPLNEYQERRITRVMIQSSSLFYRLMFSLLKHKYIVITTNFITILVIADPDLLPLLLLNLTRVIEHTRLEPVHDWGRPAPWCL